MADTRVLRIVTIATFLPAFPLCLAHGVVSHSPVPAVGLVPLAFSSGVAIFLLARQDKPRDSAEGDGHDEAASRSSDALTHPILVFTVDAILAAALMVVLVFTWIRTGIGGRHMAELAMLAAYATLPLLINFFIHLYLACRELFRGLAIRGLMQWLAWQAVPPDCPNCSHRLRPSSPPTLPWFESFPKLSMPAMPAMPKMKAPEWKTPAWFRSRTQGYTSLFVNNEEDRYRDEPDDGEPSTRAAEPVAVDVVGKKDKKGKGTPVSGDEAVV